MPDMFVGLSISFQLCVLLLLHCLMGLLAAIVAQRKGLSFKRWLMWGLIGGTASLAIALFTQSEHRSEHH